MCTAATVGIRFKQKGLRLAVKLNQAKYFLNEKLVLVDENIYFPIFVDITMCCKCFKDFLMLPLARRGRDM